MDNFFTLLYSSAIREEPELLDEYDQEDLIKMLSLDPLPNDIVQHFMLLANQVVSKNGTASEVKDLAIRFGLKDKYCTKMKNHWENSKVSIIGLKTKQAIDGADRFRSLKYSLRTKFYTKREEFKNQLKYSTLKFSYGSTKDGGAIQAITLDCKHDQLKRIKRKLDGIHKKLSQLFADEDESEDSNSGSGSGSGSGSSSGDDDEDSDDN